MFTIPGTLVAAVREQRAILFLGAGAAREATPRSNPNHQRYHESLGNVTPGRFLGVKAPRASSRHQTFDSLARHDGSTKRTVWLSVCAQACAGRPSPGFVALNLRAITTKRMPCLSGGEGGAPRIFEATRLKWYPSP